MRLSTKGRYGLRALVDLAMHGQDDEAVSISSIAARQELSESYLEQLIAKPVSYTHLWTEFEIREIALRFPLSFYFNNTNNFKKLIIAFFL